MDKDTQFFQDKICTQLFKCALALLLLTSTQSNYNPVASEWYREHSLLSFQICYLQTCNVVKKNQVWIIDVAIPDDGIEEKELEEITKY